MAEKKYTEHLGLTQQSEEDFVDGEEISRSFAVLDEKVWGNVTDLSVIKQEIGNTEDLNTASKEIVGAVNELNSDLTEQSLKIATLGSGSSGTFSGDANELRTEGICIYRTTDNTVNCAAHSVLITAFTMGGAAGMQLQYDSSYNFKTRRYWHGTWSPWK